ncbi:MAG TPA: glycosyltransferase [Candidatus Acidoferrales bacterium]|jgi:cellulose synthase/poly-beta-1,6-N-acetylglucosamine synthase-like glycosyltransferase|nr:glycosyltransferase [Candidatus Acidoferrales bacterium]
MLTLMHLFYVLVVEQIFQGLYSLWDGLNWLRLAQRRAGAHSGFHAPRVALFCPVKGAEPGLEQNISALISFDYPEYEVFFTMASADDPARKIIERVTAAGKRKIHIVIAGRPADCGEKVNNLSAAVQKATAGFDVYVFADSDGRPGRNWLARLVAPLADANLGAVTAFRWFFPQTGGFWSALASAWNAPAATYLGEHARNFCWGGGTAIRRERFEQCNVLEFWRGSVSDDFSMTHALRQAGLPILFAPECMVPATFDCDAAGLLEFTNRQIIITRVYESRLWLLGGLAHALYCGAVLMGVGMFIGNLVTGATAIQILMLALAPPVLSMGRGVLRLAAIMEVLPDWKSKLLADGWIWTFVAGLAPFLALWNSLVALFSKEIRWRGIRYQLLSPGQTRILTR